MTTIAGNGKQSYDRTGGGKGTGQGLSSPWDLALHNGKLYIAMAGMHQLWVHDLAGGVTKVWTGSGAENITDGPARTAALAQPSGITVLGDSVYFADSEVSAVRRASLRDGTVETLIGTGLFDFGFRDGPWSKARLQHPLGIAVLGDNLVVADTYNHRIRELDLAAMTIHTLLGGTDELYEPGGLTVLDGILYIADTNNHRILKLDPATGRSEEISVVVPSGT